MKLMSNSGLRAAARRCFAALLPALCMPCILLSGSASAADYVSIEIWPPDVGVFTDLGYQQFTVYGVTAAGASHDITDQVDWYLSEFGFSQQTMGPYEVAFIDADGLLTVNAGVTWGRVSVHACYPIGCGDGLTNYGGGP